MTKAVALSRVAFINTFRARQERGMSRQDAEDVIGKMAKYDDFFVNLMMNEELGLQVSVLSMMP